MQVSCGAGSGILLLVYATVATSDAFKKNAVSRFQIILEKSDTIVRVVNGMNISQEKLIIGHPVSLLHLQLAACLKY